MKNGKIAKAFGPKPKKPSLSLKILIEHVP